MTGPYPISPRCLIRGHDHDLVGVETHTNPDGLIAHTWECPTGRYRWFLIPGRELSDLTRRNRPRWGW